MARLLLAAIVTIALFGVRIYNGEGALVSIEMCHYIQKLIKRFEEDNGESLC